MTVKIEHDALLQVAQQQHQQQITQRRPQQDCCVIEDCFALERRLSFEFDDDTASVLTNSTASSDIRSVSFADTLVSDVWTRPYTPVDEIPRLFYHAEEIARYVSSVSAIFLAYKMSQWTLAKRRLCKSFFSFSPLYIQIPPRLPPGTQATRRGGATGGHAQQ